MGEREVVAPLWSPELKRQIRRFLLVGISAVLTDSAVYFLLLVFSVPATPAKITSFLVGTFVAFILNKFYTFESQEKSLAEVGRFLLLYSTTLGANAGVNAVVLLVLGQQAKILAFLCATGVSTILNFAGQRWWVFRH